MNHFNLLGKRTFPLEESGEPPVPERRTWRAPETPPRGELGGREVVVIGYGLQGRPTALNLRDSGAVVRVASYPGSPSGRRAAEEGFDVLDSAEGIPADAEAVFSLVPDEL
ncbi:MAG TPA: hypothetical protein VEI97_17120, partial [bacterium]|nr:hypothetical protein [bacterium]